jgi:hypothetical protein
MLFNAGVFFKSSKTMCSFKDEAIYSTFVPIGMYKLPRSTMFLFNLNHTGGPAPSFVLAWRLDPTHMQPLLFRFTVEAAESR